MPAWDYIILKEKRGREETRTNIKKPKEETKRDWKQNSTRPKEEAGGPGA